MFQDIGVGIFISILASHFGGVPLSVVLVAWCVACSLVPDIDLVLPPWLVGGHHGLTHYPATQLAVSVGVFAMLGPLWAATYLAAVFAHIAHDTIFLGWGIKWFWPLSQRSFKFFPDKGGVITSQILLSFLPEEEERLKQVYGSPHWIRMFYFRPSIVSVSEYAILLASLMCLYLYTR